MKKQYKQMVDTRKLYKAEALLYGQRPFSELTKQRSLAYLRNLAENIWKQEKYITKLPNIRFGRGTNHLQEMYSWCDGDTIELAPTQRDVLTLVHELVHAIGFDYHDKKFVQLQTYLLQKYTKTNSELISEAFSI